jgi:gas vesicle protein
MKHYCKYCDYNTDRKEYYEKHLLTKKHQINKNKTDIIPDISDNIMLKVVKNQEDLAKQNQEVLKQNDELKQKIEHLEKVNNQNTNKIVREAREVKKSVLNMLNSKFKDTPALDYIKEDQFINGLQLEYRCKLDENDDGLFMKIFRDYEKKHLAKSIADIILRIIIKDDIHKQAVFNIDFARGNFATKAETHWMNDKKGVELKKFTLNKVVEYMINALDIFRKQLCKISENNKTKKDPMLMDYFILNQKRMYEVSSFITNPTTHTKIMMLLCPELRFDDKFLLK